MLPSNKKPQTIHELEQRWLEAHRGEGDVPEGWVAQVQNVLSFGPGDRPVCASCGLICGIGWISDVVPDRGRIPDLVEADPEESDPGIWVEGVWHCAEECRISAIMTEELNSKKAEKCL